MSEESLTTKVEEFIRHTTELGETGIKLGKINVIRSTTNISSQLITRGILLFLGIMAILFCSLAGAWWIGNLLQSSTLGFLIVGGFYLFLLLTVLALKNKLILPYLRNRIVRMIYKNKS